LTEQELEICRSRYKQIEEERSKLFDIQKELEELKESADVKRYFELAASLDNFKEKYQESYMLSKAFDEITANTKSKAEIYIYLKTYRVMRTTKFLGDRTPLLNPLYHMFMYSDYMNVETGQIKAVKYMERDDFEKNNFVILPPKTKLEESDDFTVIANNIRMWYLNELLHHSQDIAIRKLVMHPDAIKRHFY